MCECLYKTLLVVCCRLNTLACTHPLKKKEKKLLKCLKNENEKIVKLIYVLKPKIAKKVPLLYKCDNKNIT